MTPDIKRIWSNQKAVDTLKDIFSVFPRAEVAGGWPRDILLGRTPKDIDILIEDEPDDAQLTRLAVLLKVMPFVKMFEGSYGGDASDTRESLLYAVWQSVSGIDILWVSDIQQRIEEFPDDTSKVSISIDAIKQTPEFLDAHELETITYRAAAGRKRFERIVGYFPNYKHNVIGEFPPEIEVTVVALTLEQQLGL